MNHQYFVTWKSHATRNIGYRISPTFSVLFDGASSVPKNQIGFNIKKIKASRVFVSSRSAVEILGSEKILRKVLVLKQNFPFKIVKF